MPSERFNVSGGMPSKGIVGGQYFSVVCFPVSMRQETYLCCEVLVNSVCVGVDLRFTVN